jgi:phosphoribosylaminoimidazole carboxylase (NCAIR synthetase)
MFYCADGSILINEIAPRPHNSGKILLYDSIAVYL